MAKELHIFKAGRQTASDGTTLEFSAADLAASAAAYDPSTHEAPIVIGHPRADAPAYGWIQALSASGADLNAVPHQVNADFAELVDAGAYKKISASFYVPDAPGNPVPGVYYLRHVGFLGAQPPAVKGLRAVSFAAADQGVIEFSDWGDVQSASLWRGLREWIISKFGLDEADKAVPSYTVSSLEDAARTPDTNDQGALTPAFSEPTQHPEVSVTPEQTAALEAENATLKQQLATLAAQKATADAEARHAGNVAFAEGLVTAGTLMPKHRDTVVALLDFAESQPTTVEFGEAAARKPLVPELRAMLAELPKVVEFGEVATKEKASGSTAPTHVDFSAPAGASIDNARLALHQRAVEHQRKAGCDYVTAVRAVENQQA